MGFGLSGNLPLNGHWTCIVCMFAFWQKKRFFFVSWTRRRTWRWASQPAVGAVRRGRDGRSVTDIHTCRFQPVLCDTRRWRRCRRAQSAMTPLYLPTKDGTDRRRQCWRRWVDALCYHHQQQLQQRKIDNVAALYTACLHSAGKCRLTAKYKAY